MMQQDSPMGNKRQILAFPEINTFYNYLMDRLEMILWRYYLRQDKPFYLFINALPRDHEPVGSIIEIDRFEVRIKNVGVEKLREIKEIKKRKRIAELDGFWDKLAGKVLSIEETVVGKKVFDEFNKKDFDLKDIASAPLSGKMEQYFAKAKAKDPTVNEITKAEYAILNHKNHLGGKLDQYNYISLPLIQFGEIDGVVYVIYHELDNGVFFKKSKDVAKKESDNQKIIKKNIKDLIRRFSDEYERIFVEWYYVYIIYHQKKLPYREGSIGKATHPELPTYSNKLFSKEQLDSLNYYKRYESYFLSYFDAADHLIREFRQRYRHVAILQILIDSYAHNISAHSLAALQWFFRLRAFLEKDNNKDVVLQGEFNPWLLSPKLNLDRETYFLMRFMWEKGAYWSGLIRDYQFGGKISSLFSVLWYDFVNNPLYLGTIAFSEGIQKININITLLEHIKDDNEVFFQKRIILDGTFATIDLTQPYEGFDPEKSFSSQFVIPGKDFNEFETHLKEYRAFFPGGVVGRHAFFTILENEIRNVKHYSRSVQAIMREQGLTLNISIEEDSYKQKNKTHSNRTKEYYKIGVSLEHPTNLTRELVTETLLKLEVDIIGPDNSAKLGGIYQDKICAAMLLNNTFISVQNNRDDRGQRYYPWIKLGFRYEREAKMNNNLLEEIEISHRKYFAELVQLTHESDRPNLLEAKKIFDQKFDEVPGYYKKIFHIWKGEREYEVEDSFDLNKGIENLSRFMFLSVSENKTELRNRIRALGLFRILPKLNQKTPVSGNYWNRWIKFFKGDRKSIINFLNQKKDPYGTLIENQIERIAQLYWDGKEAHYLPQTEMTNDIPEEVRDIYLIHGGEGAKVGIEAREVRYRSQGMFISYFCSGRSPLVAGMVSEYAAELFEIFDTRISIFDNRLAERFLRMHPGKLKNDLNCHIYNETDQHWARGKADGFMKNNFLIIHLSFIDQMMHERNAPDADVAKFIRVVVL